jgi:hypothetical protein
MTRTQKKTVIHLAKESWTGEAIEDCLKNNKPVINHEELVQFIQDTLLKKEGGVL